MVSIIRIKYIDYNEEKNESEASDKEVLVNIDCPLRLILNYVRNIAGLNDTMEFDLCDEVNCQLKKVSFFESYTSGLEVFQPDLTYLIVTFQRDANGQMINLTPLLSAKAAKRCSDILMKLYHSAKRNSSAKSASRKSTNTNRLT